MDKQSKLIFEQYLRRTILEQTPVNNIAPVNIGSSASTAPAKYDDRNLNTLSPTLSTQPGVKTTQFSRNWSQVGSEMGMGISKFFAENPVGIALAVLDVTQVTTAIQLPYLIDQFKKDPSTLNTIFLLLGATALVPVLGNAPEVYNALGRGLIQAGKLTGENLQKFIKGVRELTQNDSLISKLYDQLPPEMQNKLNDKLKEVENYLNKGDIISLERAKVSDLNAALLELQKTGQLSKVVTNIAPGMLIDPEVIKGVSRFNPVRGAKTVTEAGATKIKELAEKIKSISKASKIIIDLPTSLVDGTDELLSSFTKILNELKPTDPNYSTLFGPLRNGISKIKYTRNILLDLAKSMNVNITSPKDVIARLDQILENINNTPRVSASEEYVNTMYSKVNRIRDILSKFPEKVNNTTIEAAEKASKELWDLYMESINQISTSRKFLTDLLGSKAPDLARAPNMPQSVELDIPTKADLGKRAKFFNKVINMVKAYGRMHVGIKPLKSGWSFWVMVGTWSLSLAAISIVGLLIYNFGKDFIVGNVIDTRTRPSMK